MPSPRRVDPDATPLPVSPSRNPDWTALERDPNFALFFDCEAVARIERESIEQCCQKAQTYEAVQYHRGILEGIQQLRRLPELQNKRAAIRAGEPNTVATGPGQKEAANPRWLQRLTNAWRELRKGDSDG